MDVFSRRKRSDIMSRVRSKNTAAELILRRAVHRRGFRYSIDVMDLPGRPDFAFRRGRVAVFVHGCFWHSHSCRRGARPTSNERFWKSKLDANKRRDQRATRLLRKIGWLPIVVWECQLKDRVRFNTIVDRIVTAVKERREDS